MKAKTYSALQKIYDQSYLTCSTAVYYEGQGNETDALRCWRECLGQLQGYSPGAHRPKTDTERTLLRSLKTMQEQCQDRVDLLQTILLSKVEAVSAGQDGGPGRLNSNSMRLNRSPSAPSAVPYPGFYAPIPSIPLPERASTVHPCTNNPTPSFQPIAAPPPHALNPKTDRSAAADKRVLLSTLRTARKQKKGELSSLRDDGAAAAKAATLAWTSISRAQGANLSQTLNGPSVENLPTIRTGSTASGSTLDLPIRERPSPGSSRQPSPPLVRPGFPQEKYRGYDYSLPRRPSEPSFGDDPPTPPPHKQFLSTGDIPRAHSTSSLVPPPSPHPAEPIPRYSWESDPSSVKPPIPPPKIPVEPLAQPTSLHASGGRGGSGGVSDTEKYPTPSATNNTTRERIDIQQGPDISSTRRRRKPVQNEGYVLLGENEGTSPIESEKDKQERGWNERVEKALQSIGKGVDPAAARQVANEIVVKGDVVHWEDVAGLDAAKLALKEAVVYPFLRPDLFSGLREPARGMLLFGPPGTGKTMLARAVATESKSTFFSISASSLTSKYLGESEKLVRALFALAKALAPSIIFVDEIDSLLSSRSGSGEHEATRRIKTEFLIQWSDLARAAAGKETTIGDASRVLVLAATNLPWAIDEAARRRFVRRQYIPLPEATTRERQMRNLLGHQKHQLSEDDMQRLVELTDGFSGSDLTALAKDAAMGPLRSLGEALLHMTMDQIRSISFEDFEASLVSIRPSVGQEGLQAYDDWAKQYGERV